MNFQLLNLGTVPNDRTGDSIRIGGTKLNENFQELFYFSAARHRQSALVYKTTNGAADFLQYSGLDVTITGPFVGAIAAKNDDRGERNLPVVVSGTASNAWTAQANGNTWLFVSSAPNTNVVTFGTAILEPATQQTAPLAVAGQYWYDTLEGSVKTWTGAAWTQVYALFIAKVTSVGGSIVSLTYLLDNDEVILMRSEATKAAIVLG